MKKSIGPNTYLYPLPVVAVNTFDKNNQANSMIASWTGVINSSPSMISVSLRKATYSHDLIIERKAFTVSIPSKKHIYEMDFIGTLSGRNLNKIAHTGLTTEVSDVVDAPYIKEFPITLECELVKYDELGLHTMFIAEVIDIKIDEEYLNENAMPDMRKIDPIAYAHGDRAYYEVGKYLGRANRMWQTTHLNEAINDLDEKAIIDLIHGYYKKLDDSAPIDDFNRFVHWHTFKMINGDMILDSYEKYQSWYEEIKQTMFNKKHMIEKIAIEPLEGKAYSVEIEMTFTADTWAPGMARSENLEVKGSIEWVVLKTLNGMKISTYKILESK